MCLCLFSSLICCLRTRKGSSLGVFDESLYTYEFTLFRVESSSLLSVFNSYFKVFMRISGFGCIIECRDDIGTILEFPGVETE